MAKLYFRYGAMGSSKTANAVMVQYNYRERGQQVLMLKPLGEKVMATYYQPSWEDILANDWLDL